MGNTPPVSKCCYWEVEQDVVIDRVAEGQNVGCVRGWGNFNHQNSLTAYVQRGAVTALRLVKEHCLQSGGADGSLALWDVRNPQQSLHSLGPPDAG